MFDNVQHIRTLRRGHRADDVRALRFFVEGVLAGNGQDPHGFIGRFPANHSFWIFDRCYADYHGSGRCPPDETVATFCRLAGMRQRPGVDFPIICERVGIALIDLALKEAGEIE